MKQCFAMLLLSVPAEPPSLVLWDAQGNAGEASEVLEVGITWVSLQNIFVPSID